LGLNKPKYNSRYNFQSGHIIKICRNTFSNFTDESFRQTVGAMKQ